MRHKYKRVKCKDGFTMSVQASSVAYCSPRIDDGKYYKVEVGFPSQKESLLLKYAEEPEDPTNTVYGYVPVNTVYLVITKHGGMAEGEVPSGVPVYEHLKYGGKYENR